MITLQVLFFLTIQHTPGMSSTKPGEETWAIVLAVGYTPHAHSLRPVSSFLSVEPRSHVVVISTNIDRRLGQTILPIAAHKSVP